MVRKPLTFNARSVLFHGSSYELVDTEDPMQNALPLSDAEILHLCALLARLGEHRVASSGNIPMNVFGEGLRNGISPWVAVEIVALDPKARAVLLAERPGPKEDPYFSGKMALPGSVFRQGEKEATVIHRAVGEFADPALHVPERVDWMHFPTVRGDELALVHRVFVDPRKCVLKRPRDGFYPFEELPHDTLDFHVEVIRMVVRRLGW